MTFGSDRAKINPVYYDDYEAEFAGRMAQFELLGARVSSGDFNQYPEDFETVGMRIEELIKDARTHVGFRPFTYGLVRVQAIQASDNLPQPFNAVGLKSFRELLPLRHAKVVGARVWALLGTQPNPPSIEFGIDFEDDAVIMSGGATANVKIPYTPELRYEKIAALNVLTLLEEHRAE